MKLLIIGDDAVWAIENYYAKHLQKQGLNCKIFNAGGLYRKHYTTIWDKLKHKIYPTSLLKKINDQILNYVDHFQPQVIWVFKGMEIMPKTLTILKQKGYFLVNYNPDHPFIFSSRGSGNKHVTKSIRLYNLHFSYHPEVIKRIEFDYAIPCESLPFAFEESAMHLDNGYNDEINEVAFIGNPDQIRKKVVDTIAKAGIKVNVFGHAWHKFVKNNHFITVHEAVYGDTFWQIMQTYRVQLNIFRPHNIGSHNMRSFEIPSIGGIMLSPTSNQHLTFFTSNQEAFFYDDEHTMLANIKYILALPKQQAMAIRVAARAKAKSYTYEQRTADFLSKLKQHFHG
ncbi:glycosyltransferase [Pedobacter sp. UBA4863]|uniref:CgeB family protein n=1 Tax=Pedobacter sp. UBA4863 TaxID=1947060 RepID=UPI0025D8A6CD|nr:glycosyltransferase [Pedobacter sp. UBA4863]